MSEHYIDKGLGALIKAFKKPPHIRVGVFEGDDERRSGAPTNAEIAAAHEYGSLSRGLPARSILRVPLIDHLNEQLKRSVPHLKKSMSAAAKSGTTLKLMNLIAVVAETVCKTGFTNGGYGKWAQLKPATLKRKKITDILKETGQLQKAVTGEVVK